MNKNKLLLAIVVMTLLTACSGGKKEDKSQKGKPEMTAAGKIEINRQVSEFVKVRLTTEVKLSVLQQKMLPYLFAAAKVMDHLFWLQAYGDPTTLWDTISDAGIRNYIQINYGPWERLNGNRPFLPGVGAKPAGAQFYPADMTVNEFKAWNNPLKTSHYTMIRRDSRGKLKAIPYSVFFKDSLQKAALLIRKAAAFATDPGFKEYLHLRAKALLTDDYYASDIRWMAMKNNSIDFVVGPIENYEDELFGYKASYEAFILVKDKQWSRKLTRFTSLLPTLQKALPCAPAYKREMPGSSSDLNAYDAVYYAGDANAGGKTIAINLPNDERVREAKGSRKLQLKNSMKAKFDKMVVPIAQLLIAPDQRVHVKFDAFFENTMFHEVAHGLGPAHTIDGSNTVRGALKDTYSTIEEGKADILGLWIVNRLNDTGELKNARLMDNFVTFMAGMFRSVRFGASDAHGKANMIRFYYFQEKGAFQHDSVTDTYRVNFSKMKKAMTSLSDLLLTIEGNGDYQAAKQLIQKKGFIRPPLQKELARIQKAGIPRDIVFEQGPALLGLKSIGN